jgi:small subunit ribosomal protein S7
MQPENSLNKKIINLIMIHGKKAKACTVFYKALNKFENKLLTSFKFKALPFEMVTDVKKNLLVKKALWQAIENVKPSVEVKKVRVARMTYQVPAILTLNRQENLAIRWLLDSAKKRKKTSKMDFSECLAEELLHAFNKQGLTRKKRDELHKLTEINRAYIRYRWW